MSGSSNNRISGTFGQLQIAPVDQALAISVTGRWYDTLGVLHTDHANLRLPVHDAIRLHAMLATAISAAEEIEPRQPKLWSNATNTHRYGWRV